MTPPPSFEKIISNITQLLVSVNTREEALLSVALGLSEELTLKSFSAYLPDLKGSIADRYDFFSLNLTTLKKTIETVSHKNLDTLGLSLDLKAIRTKASSAKALSEENSFIINNYSGVSKHITLIFEHCDSRSSFNDAEHQLFAAISNQILIVCDRINHMNNVAEHALEVKRLNSKLKQLNRTLEEKVQAQIKELEKIQAEKLIRQRLRAEKIASISQAFQEYNHEIRTPLTVLKGELELFDPELDSIDALRALSREQISRIESIIDTTLELNPKSELGYMSLVQINQVVSELLPFYENKRIDIGSELGACPLILGNKNELRLLLDNLVKNSIDALANTENGKVLIKTWLKENTVCLSVKDNGPGIPKEVLKKLWPPLESKYSNSKGRGLGLNKIHSIVTIHSGTIEVNSELRQGTEFIFEFPVVSEGTELS